MGLREPELPFLEISFQNKTVRFKADSPLWGRGAHMRARRSPRKPAWLLGSGPRFHLVAAFFRSGYKMPPLC